MAPPAQPFGCDGPPMGCSRTSASIQSLKTKKKKKNKLEKTFYSDPLSHLFCIDALPECLETEGGLGPTDKCGGSRTVQVARNGSLPLPWAQTRTLLWLSKTQDQLLLPEVAWTKYLHEQKSKRWQRIGKIRTGDQCWPLFSAVGTPVHQTWNLSLWSVFTLYSWL